MYYKEIITTYMSRFDELSESKQFHFATRINLVTPSPWTADELERLRPWFFGPETRERMIELGDRIPGSIQLNARNERMPIFNAVPWLFGYELQLFQVLHASVQYDTDLSGMLTRLSPDRSNAIDTLASDPHSLAVLSTYLVDAYYLQARLIDDDEDALIPIETLQKALEEKLDPSVRAILNIYLLTHCVIAETLFYSRLIPTAKMAYYHQIATMLEELSLVHWNSMTIDSKLEVALCLQLTGKAESRTILRALTDAENGYDGAAGFIKDPAVSHKNNLEWAEHRNVLYLLVVSQSLQKAT